MSQVRSSGLISAHVIWALMLRESRMAFGSSHWGYLWAALQPAVTLAFLIGCFVLIGRPPPFGESLPLFFATSVLALDFFQKMSATLMRSFSSNTSLFAYPPVEKADTVIARFLLVASVYVIVWTGFYGGMAITGYAMTPYRPEMMFIAFGLIALLGLAFGMLHAVIYGLFSPWQHVERIMGRPLFFMSGVFYVPSNLPPEAVNILSWNPILHVVELVRMAYWSDYHSEIFSPTYCLSFGVITLVIALFLERYTRNRRK